MPNNLPDGCPRFLTKRFESDDRENAERACAFYIKEANLTPKQFASCDFRMKMLHPYLAKVDRRWMEIPMTEVKTTPPRTLVHAMNTHISRWKKEFGAV